MAQPGRARRSQADRRPCGGHSVGPGTAQGLMPIRRRGLRLASCAMSGHIVGLMSKHILAALIFVTASLCGPARGQDAAAPFDGDLQRLAEILGTLHYLRGICGSNDGAKWRSQMQALVDAETPPGERRARMIAG